MVKITVIPNNAEMKEIVELRTDVGYAAPDGEMLKMQMLLPQWMPQGDGFPLVVFIQGSAWTKPNQFWQLPQLSLLARRGVVVASVTHRSCLTAPAPAFLQDVKAAVRFLRAHAEEYRIDKRRICAWGTSSGGNTALLLGLIGDDPAFRTDDWAEESDAVQAVVDCFGPTDIHRMVDEQYDTVEEDIRRTIVAISGDAFEPMPKRLSEAGLARLKAISPIRRVEKDGNLPPFLLLHGDADALVPYDHSVRMADRLQACGAQVELACVPGAPHEGSFWSTALFEHCFRFIQKTVGSRP